jgi:pyruvate kinase
MVTLDTEMADDYELVRAMVESGMECARINCAKDDSEAWKGMIDHVHKACEELDKPCKIRMDLGGPKIRTVRVQEGFRIHLKKGDTLKLHRASIPGEPAHYDDQGELQSPAHISCTLPEVFRSMSKDDPIRFDDGKIEGVVREVSQQELIIEITHAKNGERFLKKNKGINFPESDLPISGLTEKDKRDLDFVVQHAEVVNLSFVRTTDDVSQFLHQLKARKAEHIGIMLKIETEAGVMQLPWLLLEGLRRYPLGVMIARGDLAVEIGWERLAILQEEILWLCQAAHVPTVWATQVLEGVAKKGIPKRAEITDAAMADQADCIMLNKGDYIIKAVEMLSDITRRRERQKQKSSSIVQQLNFHC